MRVILFSITLLVFVIGLSWYSLFYLETSSSIMLQHLDTLEAQINRGDWQAAGHSLEKLLTYWNKTHTNWKFLIDHRETDDIEIVIARLESYFKSKEQSDLLSELSALRFYLTHLPAREGLSLRNVF